MKRLLAVILSIAILICGMSVARPVSTEAAALYTINQTLYKATGQVDTLKLNKTSVTMEKGKTCQLKLKGVQADKVKWSSRNKRIATVRNGLVTAKKTGSTKIIAKYNGKKYTCKVRVRNIEATSSGELALTVDGTKLDVVWEDNESVAELKKLAPVTINMHGYGDFEQTGKLESTIVSNDTEITTKLGDIVLYNGNQICLYYDKNTWDFTRLGKIQGLTDTEIKTLLDKDKVTAVISAE